MNVLFVCTLNHARSVAAERLYRGVPGLSVRSAGTDARATHPVTDQDLLWAERVIVFEPAQEAWIRTTFAGDLPDIIDVGVPDGHSLHDPRLEAELCDALESVLGRPGPRQRR